jgi:tRNA pseudouridine55 synthase
MLSGIFNILKPPGMTSHDVVYYLRKLTGEKKIGHAGTLDPDAAGVLPVFAGTATRLLEYALAADKCYRAHMLLGVKTDTGDDSGHIIERRPVPAITAAELERAAQKLTGDIYQVPPMYSAVKHKGQKLYQLARAGGTVERAARPATVNRIKILEIVKDKVFLEIDCAKGVYIRTLLEDLARELETCATMTFLLRTRSGVFDIEKSVALEEITAKPCAFILPLDFALGHLPKLALTVRQAERFGQGVKTTISNPYNGIVKIYTTDGDFLGIGETDGETVRPRKVVKEVLIK